jgi:hypothetical protein
MVVSKGRPTFSLRAVEEGAVRAVPVARRHGDRLGVPFGDHFFDDRPTALLQGVGGGHVRELAGIAILDL